MSTPPGRAGIRFVLNSNISGGTPDIPDPDIQTITLTGSPTGGTFTLSVVGPPAQSQSFAYNASSATLQTAIRAWGSNYASVTVTGSAGGPYTVSYPVLNTPMVDDSNALTGGTTPAVVLAPDPVANPAADIAPPPMPTTAKDATWRLQWSQDFNTSVLEPSFMGTYGWNKTTARATTNDAGKGRFTAYTYPAYTDSAMRQYFTLTVVATAGNTKLICPNNDAIAGINRGYITHPNSTPGLPFPSWTRITSVPGPGSMTVSSAPTASGTYTAKCAYDGGFYDERDYSASGGICTLRVFTSSDGRHHVGAISPALGGWNGDSVRTDSGLSGKGYSGRAVLGGRFMYCMRIPDALPGYKIAHLLYPYNNNAMPEYNGEFDISEGDLKAGNDAGFFMHVPERDGTRDEQEGGPITPTTIMVNGNNWQVYCLEWRPNQANTSLSTARVYVGPDAQHLTLTNRQYGPGTTNPTKGARVPYMPMSFTLQTETVLTHTNRNVPDATVGKLQYAWVTYEEMV